jgi:hypothetical protein
MKNKSNKSIRQRTVYLYYRIINTNFEKKLRLPFVNQKIKSPDLYEGHYRI